ncbi:MAG: transposase family protein, partial [Hydrogenophaga sp.]|nr:transposase family protein [Hydrogenophaga sp.]
KHFSLQVNLMLIQAFSILPDPRTGPAQRLKEMIVMTLSAVLCGADNWVDVAEWAGDNEDWFKK